MYIIITSAVLTAAFDKFVPREAGGSGQRAVRNPIIPIHT